jgi:hypothetical protein
MSLLTELDAFFTDHRQCGDLDAAVDGPAVWIACDCGASMARRVDVDDDARRS